MGGCCGKAKAPEDAGMPDAGMDGQSRLSGTEGQNPAADADQPQEASMMKSCGVVGDSESPKPSTMPTPTRPVLVSPFTGVQSRREYFDGRRAGFRTPPVAHDGCSPVSTPGFAAKLFGWGTAVKKSETGSPISSGALKTMEEAGADGDGSGPRQIADHHSQVISAMGVLLDTF